MGKFRRKPLVIEAKQYTGKNNYLIISWAHEGLPFEANAIVTETYGGLNIRTLEGSHFASPNDWIIKGVKGEFYPCKPDIFEMSYEPVE